MPYSSYYKILGLSKGATKKEIKKAFRRKAMLTHPDRNPNQNAKEEFNKLNEAYEILIGERRLPSQQNRSRYKRKSTQGNEKEEELRKEREKRREQAKENQRKKREAYRNSPQFKMDLAIGIILDQIGYIIAVVAMLFIPVFLFLGTVGVVVSLLLTTVTYPFWHRALVEGKPTIHFKHFWLSLKYVYFNTRFKYIFSFIFNFVLFVTVVLNTFVNVYVFIILLILPIIGYYLDKVWSKKYNEYLTCLLPLFCYSVLLINMVFSTTTRYEYHKIKPTGMEDGFVLDLEYDTYEAYQGIRFFMNKRGRSKKYVQMQVAEGFFGFRVLKGYDFIVKP